MSDDLIDRLQKRAAIRRTISSRKSVQDGEPDRIADLLDEAAHELTHWKANHASLKLTNAKLREQIRALESMSISGKRSPMIEAWLNNKTGEDSL